MGASNFEKVMCRAAVEGHVEIVKMCKKWGAKNFAEVVRVASLYAGVNGVSEILHLCEMWMN